MLAKPFLVTKVAQTVRSPIDPWLVTDCRRESRISGWRNRSL